MRENNALHAFAVLALLLLLLSTTARAERRTALVIGNAAYEMGLLRNPVHDASDMATTLRQLGFEVTLLRDAARRSMVEAIDLFSRQLRQGGVGLFYFAGHGVQASGENYLIPVDARIGREQDLPPEAVPVGRVLGGMKDADNQRNIIILDACRDNPYAGQWGSSKRGLAVIQASSGSGARQWRSSQVGLSPPPTAARGMFIAYATAPGGIAADGAGENGVYTKHLLQALTIPGLSIEQVFKRVRYGLVAETEGKQIPWESSSLLDFAFMPVQTDLVPAGAPPYPSSASDPEAVLWSMSERSSHPEDVLAFLQAYPESRFAPAARLRLQQLQQQSTPAASVPSASLPGPATPQRVAGFPPSPFTNAPPQQPTERMDRPSPTPSAEGYTLIRRIYCEDVASGVIRGKDLIFTSPLSCEEAKKALLVWEQQKGNCDFLKNARERKQKANEWIRTPSCKIP